MADGYRLYPAIEPQEVESSEPAATTSPRVSDHCCNDAGQFPKFSQGAGFSLNEDHREDAISPVNNEFSNPAHISQTKECKTNMIESSTDRKQGKYFYHDSPLHEETGIWMPVSVPPLSESDRQEWSRGLSAKGAYFQGEISVGTNS